MNSDIFTFLRCPKCKSGELGKTTEDLLMCSQCLMEYPLLSGNSYSLTSNEEALSRKSKIKEFWGKTAKQ